MITLWRRLKLIPMWLFCGEGMLLMEASGDKDGQPVIRAWNVRI